MLNPIHRRIIQEIADSLSISRSTYEKAVQRYNSLANWFHREGSRVAHLDPAVFPQGSFRLGTVNRPLMEKEEYDLDLVCRILALKSDFSQEELKDLIGAEVRAYATANSVKKPVEEKRRCWRLEYADHVNFHMDILPAIPDDEDFLRLLVEGGVPVSFTNHGLAITDNTHPFYSSRQSDWPRSNPKGYALWFESRMSVAASDRRRQLVEQRLYASVDDVPAFEWKTPLQASVQILKRHRDINFASNPDLKPVSIILTTLAAHAYRGETDLAEAFMGIVDRLGSFVRQDQPRVPNPVHPAEDFADKWREDPRLEPAFWTWLKQLEAESRALLTEVNPDNVGRILTGSFGVSLPAVRLRELVGDQPSVYAQSKPVAIHSAPKPWADDQRGLQG